MSSPPLVLQNLTKKFGNLTAVSDVSFSIQSGEIFGLLGPNGAGKTTIISMIMTLCSPSQGNIQIFGKDLSQFPIEAKRQIGFVPQELIHHGFFNVEEIVHFHSKYFGIKNNQSHIEYLLKRMDLWQHRHKKVNQLSGGMKRRLLIVKALLHKPKIFLLDEPTAGVDLELRSSLWEFVKELRDTGVSILLTTHYLEEAEELCDRIAILQKGTIKRIDTKKNLIEEHGNRTIQLTFANSIPKTSHPWLQRWNQNVASFLVPKHLHLNQFLKEIQIPFENISDISIQESKLEDVMQTILNKGKS